MTISSSSKPVTVCITGREEENGVMLAVSCTYLTFGFWWRKASASPWRCFHSHRTPPAPWGGTVTWCQCKCIDEHVHSTSCQQKYTQKWPENIWTFNPYWFVEINVSTCDSCCGSDTFIDVCILATGAKSFSTENKTYLSFRNINLFCNKTNKIS